VDHNIKKNVKRLQRKKRIRRKVFGTAACPRMSVYRSLRHFYVQLIDDSAGKTVMGLSTTSRELAGKITKAGTIQAARMLGNAVAEKALGQKIARVLFDRNGFLYHGRVKALAEGAREKGLQF